MSKRTYEHYGTLENMAEAWNKAADNHIATVLHLLDHAAAHGLGLDFVRDIMKDLAYRPFTDSMIQMVNAHAQIIAEERAAKPSATQVDEDAVNARLDVIADAADEAISRGLLK